MRPLYAQVVAGYDGSEPAAAALAFALTAAEQFGGELTVVNASDSLTASVITIAERAGAARDASRTAIEQSLEPYRRVLLDEVRARVAAHAVPVRMEFATNEPDAAILDAARRWDATAIVVGTHGHAGLTRAVLGSTAESVVRDAAVPVTVVRAGATIAPLRRVVVGVDSSDPSESAATLAVGMALEQHVRLVLCTVSKTADVLAMAATYGYDPSPLLADVRAAARDVLDKAVEYAHAVDLYPDTSVIDDRDPAHGIVAAAELHHADAIVVGTHGRHGMRRALAGSVAEAVARTSPLPVIIVPSSAER